ncbi:Mif2/CENP-C like-domain-containing protein [Mrakia frigida]|uniref:Mif2p n=1 Tax=Mrakia frigida TaxID=29902 RepID=UPI003FCBFDF0
MEEQDDEEEEEEEPVVVQSKKGKGKEKAVPKPRAPKKKPASPTRKRLADMSDESDDGSGSRRSKRKRFEPLEYWRGEKFVYGRRESGRGVVPIVKEVLRLPKEEVRRLGDAAGPRGRSMSVKPKLPKKPKREHNEDDSGSEGGRDDGVPPEFGWDADTVEHGVVMDYASKTEIERRIAFPSHLLEYRTMPGDPNSFKFQKVFGDASFVAAGMLEIPVGGEKPSKPTKDNTYLFYVIEGAVTVKVHRTSFTMAPGGQFMVPRGNQYSLHTISHRPAKLFFAQARKMAADEEDVAPAPVVASTSKARSVAARSGAGSAAKAVNGKKKGGR